MVRSRVEFLLIGESKLKIVVNDEEMKKYGLFSSNTDSGGQGLRRAFWRVLDIAKSEVGFDPAGDKVLIQYYPVKSGGCEIFVTKLGILPESSAKLVSRSNKIEILSRSRSYYAFDSLSELRAFCRAIKVSSPDTFPKSDVYYDNEKYFLSIEEYGKGGETIEFPCILEFAKGLTADFGLYISEHADRLSDGDGIERFSLI
ncbi:MAG: adaptor protein MecA [Ruminococcaceae bacterium]|nr:adaptor protein MecA [Oscillospiraceae bacterium]